MRDGLLLGLLWIASFALYVAGLTSPMLSFFAVGMAVSTPIVVGARLMAFRNGVLGGYISFGRAWFYVALLFFYGGVLLAIAQFIYFNYIDHGFFLQSMYRILDGEEAQELFRNKQALNDLVGQNLHILGTMRPIDIALNFLSTNICIGVIVGLLLALIFRRTRPKGSEGENGNVPLA